MENDSNNEVRAIRRTPANSVSLPLKHGFDLFWIIAICQQSLDLQGYKIAQPWLLQNINTQCKHTDTKKQNRILKVRQENIKLREENAALREELEELKALLALHQNPSLARWEEGRGWNTLSRKGNWSYQKKLYPRKKVDTFYNLFQEWGKGPWGRPPIHAEVIEESSTDCTRRPQSSKVGCESAHLGINYIFQKETFCRNVLF